MAAIATKTSQKQPASGLIRQLAIAFFWGNPFPSYVTYAYNSSLLCFVQESWIFPYSKAEEGERMVAEGKFSRHELKRSLELGTYKES